MLRKVFLLQLLIPVLWSSAIYAKPEPMDSSTFIIRNISYHGRIYSASDAGAFRLNLFWGTAAVDQKKMKLYQKGEVLHYTFCYPRSTEKNGFMECRYDFNFVPAGDSLAIEHFILVGLFRSGCTYIVDTLPFSCSGNWVQPKVTDYTGNDTIHIALRSVMTSHIFQSSFIPDSVLSARMKMIALDPRLRLLNRKGNIVMRRRCYSCSDSVTTTITVKLSRRKKLVTDFYANGNINRIYTAKRYGEWHFFYREHHWGGRDNSYYTFHIIRRIVKERFVDTCTNYYSNGKRYKQVTSFSRNPNVGYRIVNAWDTNGVQTLRKGNGYYTEYDMWSGYKRYTIKYYKNYKLDGEVISYKDSVRMCYSLYRKGVLYHTEMKGGTYTRIEDFDPATNTYHILDRGDDGHIMTDRNFPAKEMRFGEDNSNVYFYTDANSAPQ